MLSHNTEDTNTDNKLLGWACNWHQCITWVLASPSPLVPHLVLKPSEELEVERLQAVAVGGDEIQAAVHPAVHLDQR